MNILIGTDTYFPDVNGTSHSVQRLAAALAERHEVHVVSPSLTYRSATQVTAEGVVEHRIRSLPAGRGLRFCSPVGLRGAAGRILDEVQPDVVHVHSHFPLCRALIAEARARGLYVVATNHFRPENLANHLPIGEAGGVVHDWAWRDVARVLADADVITAPTPYAAALAMVTGVPGPILPISPGVDPVRFRRDEAAGRAFRQRHELADKPTITYVGRLDASRNLDLVIRAFALVRADLDAQLLLVGTGDMRRELARLADVLAVAGDVRFTGYIADQELPAAYSASTVFVNASEIELRSLTTLEAMACELPVIAADAAALPHLVVNGDTGMLFEPGDAVGLAHRLIAVLAAPGRAQAMGVRARTVAEQHDEALTVDAFEQLYTVGRDRGLALARA